MLGAFEKLEADISTRYEVVLEYRGDIILDYRLARILEVVERKGSLLAAARSLNIPYSRVWDAIARVERILGLRIVEARRGGGRGGGARLTSTGKALLTKYLEAEEELKKCAGYSLPRPSEARGEPDLVIAYSHDPMLEVLIGKMESEGIDVEHACLGSGLALAALSLNEAYVAGLHLYDSETNTYNIPFLKRYWLEGLTEVIGGYWRQLVFAFKPGVEPISVEETLEKLISGDFTLINRNRGSGTRIYLDHLLLSKTKGSPEDLYKIRGYSTEYPTHLEAAKAVAYGKGDVALVLRYVADTYGLPYTYVVWEKYECIALKSKLEKRGVKILRQNLESKWFREMLEKAPGYSVEKPKSS